MGPRLPHFRHRQKWIHRFQGVPSRHRRDMGGDAGGEAQMGVQDVRCRWKWLIDQEEMTKIVQAIYDMLGAGAVKPTDTAEERAKNIFNRMDENNDGSLTEEEFLKGCLQDDELSKMLAPNVAT